MYGVARYITLYPEALNPKPWNSHQGGSVTVGFDTSPSGFGV